MLSFSLSKAWQVVKTLGWYNETLCGKAWADSTEIDLSVYNCPCCGDNYFSSSSSFFFISLFLNSSSS